MMMATPDIRHDLTLGEIMNPPPGVTLVYHINAGKPDEVCAVVKFISCAGPGWVKIKILDLIDDKHVPGYTIGIYKVVEKRHLKHGDT